MLGYGYTSARAWKDPPLLQSRLCDNYAESPRDRPATIQTATLHTAFSMFINVIPTEVFSPPHPFTSTYKKYSLCIRLLPRSSVPLLPCRVHSFLDTQRTGLAGRRKSFIFGRLFLASLPFTLLQNRCQKRRKTSIFGHATGWLAGWAGWGRASSNFIG